MQSSAQYNTNKQLLREIVGTFSKAETLETAINKLKSAGLQESQLGLMANASDVTTKLSHLYDQVAWDESCDPCPEVQFVERDSAKSSVNAFLGGLGAIATAAAGGAIVASAAITAGPIGAATAGATVVGGMGALATTVISESDAQRLQSRLEEGQLLLFVKPQDAEQEILVREIVDALAISPGEFVEIKLQAA